MTEASPADQQVGTADTKTGSPVAGLRPAAPIGFPIENGRIASGYFRHADEELIHQGAVVGFHTARIEDQAGNTYQRDLIRHPGAVAVVPVDGDDVLLVQQYRAPLDADLLEIPAGKRDKPDELPEHAARRELEEEVGMRAGSVKPLINVHHSPGFCDEYGHIFLATDLVDVGIRREGPEEQVMSIHRVSLSDAVGLCLDGTITDAKSVAGLLAAARVLGR